MSYNLFRLRAAPDLHCAVAQPHPVPAFVAGEDWEFAGAVGAPDDGPAGFHPMEAQRGTRLNGFYLFLALAPAARAATRGD